MAKTNIKDALTPRVKGGTPIDLPDMKDVSGVFRKFDPNIAARAGGGMQTTFTPGQISYGTPGAMKTKAFGGTTTVERGVTSQALAKSAMADWQAQAEQAGAGREQVLDYAAGMRTAGEAGAERIREAIAASEGREEERRLGFEDLGEKFGEARDVATGVLEEARGLREEQLTRTEELHAESLAALSTPFGLRMNSLIGGLKNQLGQTMTEIDRGLQTGTIDPAAAEQMKNQAKMAHGAEIGRMASQLAVAEAETKSKMTSAVNQATLAARQAAINMGATVGVSIAATMANLASAEAVSSASWHDSVRDFENQKLQAHLGAEQLQYAGTQMEADLGTTLAAMPQFMPFTPVLQFMGAAAEEEYQRGLLETTGGGTSVTTGGRRASSQWAGGGQVGTQSRAAKNVATPQQAMTGTRTGLTKTRTGQVGVGLGGGLTDGAQQGNLPEWDARVTGGKSGRMPTEFGGGFA